MKNAELFIGDMVEYKFGLYTYLGYVSGTCKDGWSIVAPSIDNHLEDKVLIKNEWVTKKLMDKDLSK